MTASCPICGQAIEWLKTVEGRLVPVNVEPSVQGTVLRMGGDRCRLLGEKESGRGDAREMAYIHHVGGACVRGRGGHGRGFSGTGGHR